MIEIKHSGKPDWLRYLIKNDSQYWTGKKWGVRSHACLYADLKLAVEEWRRLVGEKHHGKPQVILQAIVNITVAAENLDVDQLKQFLSNHAKLTMDFEKLPFEGLVEATIDWNSLQKQSDKV